MIGAAESDAGTVRLHDVSQGLEVALEPARIVTALRRAYVDRLAAVPWPALDSLPARG